MPRLVPSEEQWRYTCDAAIKAIGVLREHGARQHDTVTGTRHGGLLEAARMAGRGYPGSSPGAGGGGGRAELTPVEAAACADAQVEEDILTLVLAVEATLGRVISLQALAVRLDPLEKRRERRRESSLAGVCQACGRDVSGSSTDRVRAGYCQACYRAWDRAGRPDRPAWEHARRAELDAKGAA